MAREGLLQPSVTTIQSFVFIIALDVPNFPYASFVILPKSTSFFIRESEPNSWEDTTKDELDRTKYPRMPWHDVQCALYGPPCRDVARHFVQRWNYAKVSLLY